MKPIPRLDDDEIKKVARGIVEGHVFTATMCPPDMLSMVFMPLGLGGLSEFELDNVGNVYEWLDKAGERGINGFPMFMSCRLACQDDWDAIVDRAEKIEKALQEAMK